MRSAANPLVVIQANPKKPVRESGSRHTCALTMAVTSQRPMQPRIEAGERTPDRSETKTSTAVQAIETNKSTGRTNSGRQPDGSEFLGLGLRELLSRCLLRADSPKGVWPACVVLATLGQNVVD